MPGLAKEKTSSTITGVVRYQVLLRWASGGMADIYVARQLGTAGFGKLVALKVMRPELAQSEDFREMFLGEARTAALLSHPGIVQTFDAAELTGRLYMALEFVRGETLARMAEDIRRRGGGFPVPLALEIARQVATALHYAHTARDLSGVPLSLVHRDISPSNVMLTTDGGVKLIDFGIAKVRSVAPTTQSGVIKGKFAFMSPEQAQHGDLDARSDVYSLGVVLWEMLTGKRAHAGESDISVLRSVVTRTLQTPSGVRPQLAKAIDAVVMKAVARDRDDRFASAAAFADALSHVRSELFPGYVARNELQLRIEALFEKRGAELERVLAERDTPAVELSSVDFELPGVLPSIAIPPPPPPRHTSRPRITVPRVGPTRPPPLPRRTRQGGNELEPLSDEDIVAVDESTGVGPSSRSTPRGPAPSVAKTGRSRAVFWLLAVVVVAAALAFSSGLLGTAPALRSVMVTSTPPAELYVDGHHVGRSPLSVQAHRGRDTLITAELPGYASWRGAIHAEDRATELTIRLERAVSDGTLVVRTDPPGARVHVDGVLQPDMTPLVVTDVPTDVSHTLLIAADGHESAELTLDFAGESALTINAVLVPLSSGYLTLDCTPGSCMARVDGHPLGRTPIARHRLLASHTHRVELIRNGRAVLDEEVTLSADEERTLLADIETTRRERRAPATSAETPTEAPSAQPPAVAVEATETGADPAEEAEPAAVASAQASEVPVDPPAAAAEEPTPEPARVRIRNIMGRYLSGGAASDGD